ncbi:MAG: hypothetical protein WAM79_05170 [Candidatus Sulfotelmatobacter sp.]
MRGLWSILFVFFSAYSLFSQAEWPKPNWEKVDIASCRFSHQAISYHVGGYQVKLIPGPDLKIHDSLCRAYLVARPGHETHLLTDWAISIYQGAGEDLFGNGHPSLILEGYSGGAHCCFTYRLVDLAEKPVVLSPIKNASPFFFFKDPASKQFRIMAGDGAFDYFDGMCHACAPFPRVVLRADDAGLRDVSADFVEQYDSEIALARAKIGNGEIGQFQIADFNDAKAVVLEIVYCYLYSGREQQAWQTLDEMWPAAGRERIKKLIVAMRAKGLLSELVQTRSQAIPAASVR